MVVLTILLTMCTLALCEKIKENLINVEKIFEDLGLNQIYKNHKEEAESIVNETVNCNTTLVAEMEMLLKSILEFKESLVKELSAGMDNDLLKEMTTAISDLMDAVDNLSMSREALQLIYELNKGQIEQYYSLFNQCNTYISDLLIFIKKQSYS